MGLRAKRVALGFKGGETKTFLLFLVSLLTDAPYKIANGDKVVLLGNVLLRHLQVMDESPRVLSQAAYKDMKPTSPCTVGLDFIQKLDICVTEAKSGHERAL